MKLHTRKKTRIKSEFFYLEPKETIIKKAYQIAVRSMKECYGRHGIMAGLRQFREYWARDGCFASFGALRLRELWVVKREINLMLQYQKKSGQIPLKVSRYNFVLRYMGFLRKRELRPSFNLDYKLFGYPMDQNSLLVLAAIAYIRRTNDFRFAWEILHSLRKAMKWNIKKGGEFLLKESRYSNWADSVGKIGYVLYTNVCYYRSLTEFAWLQKKLKDPRHSETLEHARKIKEIINRKFWNGEYYYDWIGEKKPFDYFATDGNILAILWGVADKAKSQRIMSFFMNHHMDDPVPAKTNFPYYKQSTISVIINTFGLGGYHNSAYAWMWLGCIETMAQLKLGMNDEAERTFLNMAKTIVQFNDVYEIYDMFGQPAKGWFYHSEHPFAWSAGMFIETYHVIRKHRRSLFYENK